MSRSAILSLLGILALCLGRLDLRAQSADRVISGTVISEATGQPLEGAEVTLQDTNGFKPVADTGTDAQGRFSFTNLPDGKFALSASHRGYVQATYEEHDGPFTAIVTGEDQNTTGLVLSLPPLGVIFGTIAEDSGDPVPQARLLLFRQSHFADSQRVVRAGETNADAMGNFEFSRLMPGTYLLCASGVPWYRPRGRPMGIISNLADAPTGTAIDQPRSPLDVAYPLTCYPETTDPSGAEPIFLKAGEHVEANVTLHPVPAMHMLFQLPQQDPRRGVSMPQLHQDVFGFPEFIQSRAFVQPRNGNASGPVTYEIADVPPGQYSFEVRGSNPAQDTAQFGAIQVSSSDVSIDASSLQPMASVSGKLIVAGGGAVPSNSSIVLVSDQEESRGWGTAMIGADGSFQTRAVPPGDYEVQVIASNLTWAVTQLRVNGARIEGSMLKVGGDPVELTVVATKPAGSIRGFVTRNDKPTGGVFLALVPFSPDASRFAWQPNQSDSDGSFIFENVFPGDYTVVAIDQGWTLDWRDRSVIAPYLARGAKVTLGANSKAVTLNSLLVAQMIGAHHAQ